MQSLKEKEKFQTVEISVTFKEEENVKKDVKLDEMQLSLKGSGGWSFFFFKERENILLIEMYENKH